MNKGFINLYIDDQKYHLSLYEAKELYYTLRDLFDPNFYPSRDRDVKRIKTEVLNNK